MQHYLESISYIQKIVLAFDGCPRPIADGAKVGLGARPTIPTFRHPDFPGRLYEMNCEEICEEDGDTKDFPVA